MTDRKQCKIEGCTGEEYVRGMCSAHYQRSRRGRDMKRPIEDRSARTTPCESEGCNGKRHARGLCRSCYEKKLWRNRKVTVRPKAAIDPALYHWGWRSIEGYFDRPRVNGIN